MAINDGDILAALRGIEINSTKVVNNTAILDNLQDIQQDVQLIRQISQGTQRTAQTAARNAAQAQAQARARDTRRTETAAYNGSYQPSSRTTSTNKFSRDRNGRGSFSSSTKGVVDDFLSNLGDGIQEELKKSLKESPLHTKLRKSLQDFAKEMGVNVSEIPAILGKDLGKTIIRRSGVGKRFASTLNDIEENIFSSVSRSVKSTMGRRARQNNPNAGSDEDIFQQAVSNFKTSFKQRYGRTEERETQEAVDRASQSSSNTASGTSDISSEYSTLLTNIDTNVAEILDILRTVNGIEPPKPEEQMPEAGRPEAPQGSNPPQPSDLTGEASPNVPQGENRNQQGSMFGDLLDMFQNKSGGNNFLTDMIKNSKFGQSEYGSKLLSKTGDMYSNLNKFGRNSMSTAKDMLSKFGNSEFGSNIMSKAGNVFSKFGIGSSGGGGFLGSLFGGGSGAATTAASGTAATAAGGAAGGAAATGTASTALATTGTTALGSTAGGAAAGGAMAAGSAIPQVLIAIVAIKLISAKLKQFAECFTPAIEGIKGFKEALKKAGNRYWSTQRENLENEQKRIEADIQSIAKRPFEIMEAAAQDWYNAWENNLKTITATQGYTKADVQTLFSSYASRLRGEGLESVISAADISTNLGKVLEGGLSGAAAEEFAYLATILENAIPTQDFFSYSDTYAQVVAQGISKGLGESDAIQAADAQLQQFASNLLYANRNISGGLSSALKDGKKLWEDSVKIAASARIADSSNISGVLTAVAAQVGAIAPDLASELVDKVVSAAIGGNSNELVALRSIAGVGASNSEFLRILANDPKSLFVALFSNLAKMQQMNADNFMEVAEGLSETFGIPAEAFARVDFQSLASAISAMQVNTASLSENMALLSSKQTVTSDEQLKMQQINKMILDEGLAYVLDNEAARAIQQHMWDQELANEMAQREYSVELAGEAKKALQGIAETVSNILNFLNPFAWVGKLVNMVATAAEYDAQKRDIAAVIEKGKVGQGNAVSFSNLTNFSSPETVPQLIEMMGGASAFGAVNGGINFLNSLTDASGFGLLKMTTRGIRTTSNAIANAVLKTTANKVVSSRYSWGFVGKSIGDAIANSATAQVRASTNLMSADDRLRKAEAKKINDILGTMDAAIGGMPKLGEKPQQKSFAEWWQSAVSKFSTKSNAEEEFKAALERTGVTEEQMKGQYEAKQAQQASEFTWKRDSDIMQYVEEIFPTWQQKLWDKLDSFQTDMNAQWKGWRENDWTANWVKTTWNKEWVETAWGKTWISDAWKKDWIDTQWSTNWLGLDANKNSSTSGWNWKSFMDTVIDRFIKYTTYTAETKNAYKAIDTVKSKEKEKESGDAVLALAKALTNNTAELKDPAVQTNALLAQILIVLEAIMQAENTSGGATLATTLSALGLGLTSTDLNTTST